MSTMRRCGFFLAILVLCGTPAGALAAGEIDQTVEVVSDPWNSLEVVRLVISLLTPIAILGFSVWMDHRIKEFEHRQWSNQKVIEKRLEVYEKLTPQLNELMCYFMRVGGWKEHAPPNVVDMKRDLDKIAHVYAPLFSPRFMERYNAFMEQCFATFRGAGLDAQLKAECEHYRTAYAAADETGRWKDEWDDCFTGPDEASDRNDVRAAYLDLVNLVAEELGVGLGRPSK